MSDIHSITTHQTQYSMIRILKTITEIRDTQMKRMCVDKTLKNIIAGSCIRCIPYCRMGIYIPVSTI